MAQVPAWARRPSRKIPANSSPISSAEAPPPARYQRAIQFIAPRIANAASFGSTGRKTLCSTPSAITSRRLFSYASRTPTTMARRRAIVVGVRDAYENSLRDVIAEGVEQRVFRPVDPKLAAFAILGAMNWMARWYRAGGGASADEIGEEFAGIFLEGLRAHAGT